MEFPDFPYPNGTKSYPSHDVVWKYLDSYADRFRLKERIKFHHVVQEVHHVREKMFQSKKWKITARDAANKKNVTNTFDAVFVCTGVASTPYTPKIDGNFVGKIIHSHDYRRAGDFRGLSNI